MIRFLFGTQENLKNQDILLEQMKMESQWLLMTEEHHSLRHIKLHGHTAKNTRNKMTKPKKEPQTCIAIETAFRDELRAFCAERGLIAKQLVCTVLRQHFEKVRQDGK